MKITRTRDKIFGNQEYTLVTIFFKTSEDNYIKSLTLEHNGKEIMKWIEGGNKSSFSSASIKVKHPDYTKKARTIIITPILNKWKRKYEYEFEGINFPDEESLCLFMMELANEV